MCLAQAPRVYAWTDVVDDLSGQAADAEAWLQVADARRHLGELLTEIGRVYVPALLANARALASGEKEMQTQIDGRLWIQPTFPYQGRCLQWIRGAYADLAAADQQAVQAILADTGCEPLLVQSRGG